MSVANPFEFYETPQASTRFLFRGLKEHGHPVKGFCVEPCVGSEAILRASQTQACWWKTNDIDPRWPASFNLDATKATTWDQLETAAGGQIDWTITNPPFSLAEEILPLALKYSQIGVAMHLRGSFNEPLKTGARRTLLYANPPTGQLWLPRFAFQRSQKTGEWSTDSVTCCWFIWIKHARHQFTDYASPEVNDELSEETDRYRERMDALMARRAA